MPKSKKTVGEELPEKVKITNYFSKSLDPNNIQKKDIQNTNTNTTKDFYSKCLNDQLNPKQCESVKCINEKKRLEQLLAKSKEKFEHAKKATDACERVCKRKDEEIAILEAQLKMQYPKVKKSSSETLLYSEQLKQFTATELSELRSIGGNQSEDSAFVLTGIRYIYKNQTDRLNHISVTGRSRTGNKKTKMSPNKLAAIKDIFNERLNALNLTSDEQAKREKRINLLVKDAIQNIANPKANDKQKLQELNDKINVKQTEI